MDSIEREHAWLYSRGWLSFPLTGAAPVPCTRSAWSERGIAGFLSDGRTPKENFKK